MSLKLQNRVLSIELVRAVLLVLGSIRYAFICAAVFLFVHLHSESSYAYKSDRDKVSTVSGSVPWNPA